MRNGWTGGQYSLARALLGLYLLWQAVGAVAQESPAVRVAGGVAAVLSVLFILGALDRIAAIALAALLAAWAFGQYGWSDELNRLAGGPWEQILARLILAALLVTHALQPPQPYGSLTRRGQPDPGAGWTVRPMIFAALWIIMAIGYTVAGVVMLTRDPSWRMGDALAQLIAASGRTPRATELLRLATWLILATHLAFAPLALVGRLRPWLWLGMLAVNLALVWCLDSQALRAAVVMAHLFTFDPGWIRPCAVKRKTAEQPDWIEDQPQPQMIFYDGHCGLCHRWVRFVLSEDRTGRTFEFAPLQSQAFENTVPAPKRAQLPDSIVVRTTDGELLSRSDAITEIAARLGGIWRPLGALIHALPRFVRDGGYDFVARVRHRLFQRPADACPLLPPDLRRRFKY